MHDPSQLSNEIGLLDNTLRVAEGVCHDALTYDADLSLSPFCDLQFIHKCSMLRPDLVVFSSWGKRWSHPSMASINFVRHRLEIPVATIWWDTCNKGFWPTLEMCIGAFDLHVIADNARGCFLDKKHPLFDRVLQLWAPLDPDLYNIKNITRDIPVSFIGQTHSYRGYRREYLQYLIDSGVDGYFTLNNEGGVLSHREYAEIIQRSQICINFSYSADTHQLKGRVLEAMLCGALLLESENNQTSVLFKSTEDYVSFSSKEDLYRKIKYYQAHPEEMETIAQSGMRRAHADYTGINFWAKIFRKLNL